MSDSVLSVVPTDPRWQPAPDAGCAAANLVASLALAPGDGGWSEVKWHDEIAVIDCGENLERIQCPHCRQDLGPDWFADLMEEWMTSGTGFARLDVVVPCCGAFTTLDRLDYSWPMAFARFEIAVWNGSHLFNHGQDGLLATDAVAAVEATLGHPVRQVRAHY